MRSRYGAHAGRRYALTTVVTMRSYSRNSGETSLDAVTSRPVARSAIATARSGSALRSAWSSTPRPLRRHRGSPGTRRPTLRARCRRRRAGRRPRSAIRAGRAARVGRRTRRRATGGAWRAISMTSAKPRVATSATRAPRRSSSALVATVVPCASTSGSRSSSLTAARRRAPGRRASRAPWRRDRRPSTASVNVPPVSTPNCTRIVCRAQRVSAVRPLPFVGLEQVAAGPHGADLEAEGRDAAPQPQHVDVERVAGREAVRPGAHRERVAGDDRPEAVEERGGQRLLDGRQRDPVVAMVQQPVGVEVRRDAVGFGPPLERPPASQQFDSLALAATQSSRQSGASGGSPSVTTRSRGTPRSRSSSNGGCLPASAGLRRSSRPTVRVDCFARVTPR